MCSFLWANFSGMKIVHNIILTVFSDTGVCKWLPHPCCLTEKRWLLCRQTIYIAHENRLRCQTLLQLICTKPVRSPTLFVPLNKSCCIWGGYNKGCRKVDFWVPGFIAVPNSICFAGIEEAHSPWWPAEGCVTQIVGELTGAGRDSVKGFHRRTHFAQEQFSQGHSLCTATAQADLEIQ